MCGICGIINLDGSQPDKEVLNKMTRHLKHRGDNAHGEQILRNAGLGHQRLSILDLSENANQPLPSRDRRFWIVFNGEVYNFQSLRKELEEHYQFTTASDTEVVLYSWLHWGKDCLERMNGMFAFAIWDKDEQILYCARDRMGVKPFFYYKTDDIFIFASEIKAILLHPEVSKKIDYKALSDYLSLGYITGDKTIFDGIKKLLPARSIIINVKGEAKIEKYWDIRKYFSVKYDGSYTDKIKTLLEDSVKSRLISDVDIGFFVSGGIDSTAVLKYASKHYDRPTTFSLGFPQESYSELAYAERFTGEMKTTHYSTIFHPPDGEFLKKLMWFYDQPFADTSSIPTFQLCDFASQKIKVVLSGDGGDEMFGGYETYRADLIKETGQNMIPFWKTWLRLFSCLFNILPADFSKVSTDYKLRQFMKYAHLPLNQAHYSWRLLFDEKEKRKMLHPEIVSLLGNYNSFDYFEKLYEDVKDFPSYQQIIYVDFNTWLVDDILTKIDTASMAHSLEVRSPFLDRKIVEFSVAIPNELKVDLFHTKKILKKALSAELPEYIVRRKKEGFNSPVSLWLTNDLRDLFMHTIETEWFKSSFPATEYIHKIFEEHCSKKRDWGFCLWALLMFGLWAENYLT